MPVGNKKIWKSNLKKAGEIYRNKKVSQVRAVTLQALREIMMGSPVDTGRFRSNWMVAAGKRNETTTEDVTVRTSKGAPPTKKKRGKKVQQSQTQPVIPVTNEELKTRQKELDKLGKESRLFITNNLPYAQRLEEGHSSQNKGFVRRAKENAKSRFAALDDVTVT